MSLCFRSTKQNLAVFVTPRSEAFQHPKSINQHQHQLRPTISVKQINNVYVFSYKTGILHWWISSSRSPLSYLNCVEFGSDWFVIHESTPSSVWHPRQIRQVYLHFLKEGREEGVSMWNCTVRIEADTPDQNWANWDGYGYYPTTHTNPTRPNSKRQHIQISNMCHLLRP